MRSRSTTILILLVTIFPLFLGNDLERWVQGIVLTGMGLTFVLYPPTNTQKRGIGWLCLALFGAGLTSFLPASWFATPPWRTEVTTDLGIHLPGTLSPQPWISLDYIILLGAGILWIYYLTARTWKREEGVFAIRALGVCVFVFTIASLLGFLILWAPPSWQGQNNFGPIANRNQMAIILCLGSLILLACAEYDYNGQHKKRALVWASGFPLIFWSLVINGSRAGILLFFAGLGIWIAVSGFRSRSVGAQAGIVGSILLLAAATFFLFGGRTLDRFELQGDSIASQIQNEARYQLFSDTIDLIANAPAFGIGFGNFAPVFALNRSLDRNEPAARVAQPDNDWLWIASEMGLIGLCISIAIIVLLVMRAYPFRSRRCRDRGVVSLRIIATICVAIFCLDGLVNIPGHRLSVVLLGLLLLSLALHTNRRKHSSRFLKLVFPVYGIALIAVGSIWFTATVKKYPLPGRLGIELLEEQSLEAHLAEEYDSALELINRVIKLQPLRYRHYYKRATIAADLGLPLEQVQEDFRIARRLEPTHPVLPLGEVEFWLQTRPVNAIVPLKDAMVRAPKMASTYYRRFAMRASVDPLFEKALSELAFEDPENQLTFLFLSENEEKISQIDRILEKDPSLAEWQEEQQRELFRIWYRAGNRDHFEKMVSSQEDWKDAAWPSLFIHYGSKGDYAAALDLAEAHFLPPTLPRFSETLPIGSLRSAFLSNATDISLGIRLYALETKLGNTESAISALLKVSEDPACPDYVFFVLSKSQRKSDDLQSAWESLSTYFRRKRLF